MDRKDFNVEYGVALAIDLRPSQRSSNLSRIQAVKITARLFRGQSKLQRRKAGRFYYVDRCIHDHDFNATIITTAMELIA